MKVYLILLVLIFMNAGCAREGFIPSDIMQQQQMQDLVWDVMVAEEYAKDLAVTDTVKNKNLKQERSIAYQQVFDLHHTTREDFKRSFDYYASHPDLSKVLFDTLSKRANRKRESSFRMITPPKLR